MQGTSRPADRPSRIPVAAALVLLCGLAPAALSQTCDTFERVSSPNVGTEANRLLDVAVVAADDVWAVGYRIDGADSLPMAMHWDGSEWTVTPMPAPPSGVHSNTYLNAVAAFSPTDVWAVGSHTPPPSAASETIAYHWDGSAWQIVPSPAGCCGSFGSQFHDIGGVSGADFWAVGEFVSGASGTQPLAAHWNGSSWEEIRLPNVTTFREGLKDLHVAASDDIWALEAGGFGGLENPRRIFHWDGSDWSEAATRLDPLRYGAAETIFVLDADDIWVSSVLDSTFMPVMLHWDGSSWTELPAPGFGYEIFGDASDDLYAVGGSKLMHWDGVSWTVAAELPGFPMGGFFGADLASDGTLWAVGLTEPGPASQTLTARYAFCDGCYADCDQTTGAGVLDFFDFICFQDFFAAGDPYADCDRSTGAGVFDFFDFICFQDAFAAGCP